MRFLKYFITIILIFLIAACDDDTCNTDTESLLLTEFNVLDTALINVDFLENLSVYSPEWSDSIHFSEEGTSNNTLSFMLSPLSDTSELILTSANAPLKDTLMIFATRELVFHSVECGFITNFFIDSIYYSYNYIDSLKITNNQISITKDGQIEIYF